MECPKLQKLFLNLRKSFFKNEGISKLALAGFLKSIRAHFAAEYFYYSFLFFQVSQKARLSLSLLPILSQFFFSLSFIFRSCIFQNSITFVTKSQKACIQAAFFFFFFGCGFRVRCEERLFVVCFFFFLSVFFEKGCESCETK
jgi:hypothetical protein